MFCAKVFAILCIIIGLSNGYYQYHHRHGHNCYYNYPQQCVVRRGPSICKEWCLVYYFDGYCYRPKYDCCVFKEKPGYCSIDRQLCTSPFLYYSTRIYECLHDYSCPIGYKCCKDSCYVHKICKPYISVPPQNGTTTSRPTRDTEETTVKSPGTIIIIPVTTERITTTTIPETTTTDRTTIKETTTMKPPETTTTSEMTTTERHTTLGPTTVITTPTSERETTTLKETTTQKQITTTPILTTTSSQMTTRRTPLPTVPEITTPQDLDGSGSGDLEIPDPESARYMLPKKHFDGFDDDEDHVEQLMK